MERHDEAGWRSRRAAAGFGRGALALTLAMSLAGAGGAGAEEQYPLLGGPRGGNVWANFCEGQPNDARLPIDPRTKIVEGVNEGKAVAFNAYWRDCENGVPRPTDCGEFREQLALGYFVGEGQGMPGTPTTFAGGQAEPGGLDAEDYNNLWQVWGLDERPDNFDELVAERHGSPQSTHRNPYPLPGQDPNLTNGGLGQLPLVYTQIRKADGTWTGRIGTKVCVFCHNGQLGTEADGPGMGPQIGGAGSIGDFTVGDYDFAKVQGTFAAPPTTGLVTISTNRGTGAIDFFQIAFLLFSRGDPELLANDKIVFSQAIGNIKSPPWWNLGYRPQKFHGAVFPTDSSRIDMAAYYDLGKGLSGRDAEALAWVDAHAGPFQVWAESLPSPQFPGEIDEGLAEIGATIFHEKNLWAPELKNTNPPPAEGNGSCAGCHGAYSPFYAHKKEFLDSPDFAGIAAYTVPMDVIGTDPVYAEAMQSFRNPDGSTNEAILKYDFLYCGQGNAAHTENNTPILLAPPLWGIWASAPYFHNGSVPNVWGVLDPSKERPRIWRRVSTPARPDQEGKVVMGYDTNLQRAYEFDKLGWRYDELQCGDPGTQPGISCNPLIPGARSPVQNAFGLLYENVGASWNLPRPEGMTMTQEDIENRKIYNTYLYSQGNQGHAFTSVLNDDERRALIEYLKTL